MPETAGPPQPIGLQLGLGPHWQPAPFSWAWFPLNAEDGSRRVALKVEHVAGTLGVVFDTDSLLRFGNQAAEQATGLVVASPGDVPTPQANGGQPNRAMRRHPR